MADQRALRFEATEVGVVTENAVLMCGASNAAAEAEYHYITFQRQLDEETTGSPEIHFEVDDQINGGYDLVSSCALSRSALVVALKRQVPWHPGLSVIEVALHAVSDNEFAALAAGLAEVFAGSQDTFSARGA